jgi:phosphopantothenoylcysteine decarboxylase/phosphopantothenate--cysteine ligase
VGFKALHDVPEEELVSAASRSLKEHSLDIVVANDVSKGIFGSDETEAYIVDKGGAVPVPRTSKAEAASRILDAVLRVKGK